MIGRALALALLLAAPAAAQPWRYEKDGVVGYTDNLDDLPPAMKARILAARAARADAGPPDAAPPVEPDAAPPPEARPGRIKGEPARPAGSPPVAPPDPPKPPPEPEPAPAGPDLAALRAELAEARAALTAARRQALLVPDGRTFAARTAAEARVAELEAAIRDAQR